MKLLHTSWLYTDKRYIVDDLLQRNLPYIEFLHWLFIPKLSIVLSFDKQKCCYIDKF